MKDHKELGIVNVLDRILRNSFIKKLCLCIIVIYSCISLHKLSEKLYHRFIGNSGTVLDYNNEIYIASLLSIYKTVLSSLFSSPETNIVSFELLF